MEPYNAKLLPFDYKIDKELLKLISEANVKYGTKEEIYRKNTVELLMDFRKV